MRWNDTQSNWSNYSKICTFTVCTHAPVVTITSPSDGKIFTAASQNVTGTVTGALDITSATLTLNGVSRSIPVTSGNFSEAITLTRGQNTISVSASNIVGTEKAGPITVTYLTKPVVTIASPTDGSIFAAISQNVTGTVEGANITSTILNRNGIDQMPEVTLVGGNFTYTVYLEEGSNKIIVRATNAANLTGTSPIVTVKRDTKAPTIVITSPTAGLITNNPSQTVKGTIDDIAITKATLILNGAPRVPAVNVVSGNFTYQVTLAEGENTIEVTAADNVTPPNIGSSVVKVVLDTRPPVVKITSPANNYITNTVNQTITGTIDDLTVTTATLVVNDIVQPAVDAVAVVNGAFSCNATLTKDWPNTIVISASDKAGNTGSSSIVIIHDATKPVVTITSPPSGQTTGTALVTVTGNITSDTAIGQTTLTLNGVSQNITVTEEGKFGQDVTLSPGVNTIEVTATDAAGNTGSSGILTITLDTTAPVIKINTPKDGMKLGTTSHPVEGKIDDKSITSATLTLNALTLYEKVIEIEVHEGNFNEPVTLTVGSNDILVSASDAYGNKGTSDTIVVEVKVEVEVKIPEVTVIMPASGSVTNAPTLAVSGTVNKLGIDSVRLILNGKSEKLPASALRVDTTANVTGFGATVDLVKGVNTIVVTATDNATPSNNGTSGEIKVTRDNTRPTVSLTSPTSDMEVNTENLTVTGSVDDPYVISATLTLNGDNQTIPVQGGSFSRIVTLSTLRLGENKIKVSASDSVGNMGMSPEITVTLAVNKPMVSVISPTDGFCTNNSLLNVSANVTCNRTISSVILTLNEVHSQPMDPVVGIAGRYETTVTLSPDVNTIKVVATDNIGNPGSSGVLHVTLDTTPPILVIGLSNPTKSILIGVTSDEPLQGRPTASINGTTEGGKSVAASVDMTLIDVNKWSGTYPAKGVLADGSYTVSINGTDIALNTISNDATFIKKGVTTENRTVTIYCGRTTLVITTNITVEDASLSVTQHLENPAENAESGVDARLFLEAIASSELRAQIKSVYIEVRYDKNEIIARGIEEATLKLYLWNTSTGEWELVPPIDATGNLGSGVNTAENFIYGTVPHLSKYGSFGTAKIDKGDEITGDGLGGVGPGGPSILTISFSGLSATPDLKVDSNGIVQETCRVKTTDEKAYLDIIKGTKLLYATGELLGSLSASKVVSPQAAPAERAIISAYDFGPAGAKFEPYITLVMIYDTLPTNAKENDLYIAYWDGTKWVALDSAVDTTQKKVTAPKIYHFTQFALMAKLPTPTPTPVITPIPTPTPAPATFAISGFSVTPSVVKPTEQVIISAVVTNTGGSEGSYTVVLKINGVEEARKEVTLGAGKSETVSFTVKKDVTGIYTVNIDDKTGQFTVTVPPPIAPPAKPVNWALIWGIVGGVIVLGLILWLGVFRPRARRV